jgi:hypothetical protein
MVPPTSLDFRHSCCLGVTSVIQVGQKIQSKWDDKAHTVILTIYHPYWTWEELHDHEENVMTPMLLLSSCKPVSLMMDMSQGTFFDPKETTEQVRQTGLVHRTLPIELVVFVLRDEGVGTLLKALHERYGAPNHIYRLARSVNEARAIIDEYRGQARYSA